MNKTPSEAIDFIAQLKPLIADISDIDIVIAPPFTALQAVSREIEGSNITLGAQNVFWEASGAFTGEVSPTMVRDVGCRYVIIGHSERRQYFGETNETVNRKVVALLPLYLQPILCIGETLEERQAGKTLDILADQLSGALTSLEAEQASRLVLAYEPVWAIGTGLTATPEQAQEAHAFIRESLAKRFNNEVANNIRILYGGSVKPENVDELMAQPDIDGALVGGASLNAASFIGIIEFKG